MRTLYESIMDDDETIISHTKEGGLRFSVDQMLDSGKVDKQLIKELQSKVAIYPVSDKTLKDIVTKYIKLAGDKCSLNWIDTSEVTYMVRLFSSSYPRYFEGDISKWNVSNVRDMSYMFANSEFNEDISNWDVSNVENMDSMFSKSKFNGNISDWDVSNVKDMNSMFDSSEFNQNISDWDVSNVKDMAYMFFYSKFNQDISNWNVKKVKRFIDIFTYCPINPDYKPKFH